MARISTLSQNLRHAWQLSRYGDRGADRLRILLLCVVMPVIRRVGRGRRIGLRVRVDGEVVPWVADNYADVGVLEEIFGRSVYDLGDLPPPATIIDLGSHVGASVLFFSRRYPEAEIIAVEADPLNFAKLAQNVGHLPRVRLVPAAVAAETGTITLFSSGGVDSWKSSTRRFTAWQRPVQVKAFSLDDLLAGQAAKHPILVKIDIEGAEYEVLRACGRLGELAAIVGEVHPGLIAVALDEFRALLRDFELDLSPAVEHDTPFRARRRPAGLSV